MTAREVAISALLKTAQSRGYSNIELDAAIKKFGLTGVERSFFTALFYGVIEKKITLDYIVSKLSSRDIGDIDIKVLTILEAGLYQLKFMDKVPESAAVNESVKLCARFLAPKNSGAFVNAVLREYIRRGGNVSYPDEKKEPIKYLSVAYSVPEWMCALWKESFGGECEALLSALSVPPKMTLRANTLKNSADELISALGERGVNAHRTEYSPVGVKISGNMPKEIMDELDGAFFVQDEASQIAVCALGATPGDAVLDVCACPGGKSFGAAMDMKNNGAVLSLDLHGNKLGLIEKTAAKLGISIIKTGVSDAGAVHENIPTADKIICDVPCSGLGVIAKKPDIRYKSPNDIKNLPSLQKKILEASSSYLKDGGVLVYSTCTLNPAENEDVVNDFLSRHADFSPEPFSVGKLSSSGMITLTPNVYGTDGFFIAKLRRAGGKR